MLCCVVVGVGFFFFGFFGCSAFTFLCFLVWFVLVLFFFCSQYLWGVLRGGWFVGG